MNILGLDPANRTGYAHSGGHRGVWEITNKRDKHPGRRLERLRSLLFQIKRTHGIDLIACEDASFGSLNQNTAAMHNELRGVIKLFAAEIEVPVTLYKPTQVKKWLTGKGNAKKPEMIRWVAERFNITTDDDNLADAVAILEMARESHGGNDDGNGNT